ncbi:MAG: amidohydrolase family protein [Gemmatimonadota bacterium]
MHFLFAPVGRPTKRLVRETALLDRPRRAATMVSRFAVCVSLLAPAIAPAQRPPNHLADDSATILVSLIERAVGTETYTLRSIDGGHRLSSVVRLVDRGTPLAVDASLDVRDDLTPTHFRASGKSYRFVTVDADVAMAGDSALVRTSASTTVLRHTGPAFPAQGWPPMAARALLVRYWERHGRPERVRLLPGDTSYVARIRFRGIDTVRVEGRRVPLRRYVVQGVVWGREALWLDPDDRFAALVTRIHILPMEGVRADLATALPQLQASAIADRMSDLRQMTAGARAIASGDYALTGIRIIDGTGRAPIEDAVLRVRDGRIAQVGTRADVALPHAVRTIDGRGATVIPGLWDMHAHASQVEWAPAYLAAGVTTIRDMGGEERFLLALRETLAASASVGPRVLLAGLVDGDDSAAFGAITAASPAEGRGVVDRYHAAGFSQMKLYSMLQPDVVRAIVERAHALGMTVTGHVPRSLGIVASIDAGMDQVAHIPIVGDTASAEVRDVIARLASRHVVVDPTLPWNELLGRSSATAIERFEPGILHGPPAMVASYRTASSAATPAAVTESFGRQLAVIRAMHDAGVPLVAGTDGALPGYSLLRSIELFVQAGFTPMEALESATLVPATAMGEASERGTLEAGKRADFVVLDGNPLDDIANIRRTRWVARDGRMVESRALWPLAGFRE